MKLKFEENKRENTVKIFQTNGVSKIRIAYYDKDKDKVILTAEYKKLLGDEVKQTCEVLKAEYQNWLYSTSPLRNLSKEQLQAVRLNMNIVDVLSICLQDCISNLSVLDKLDQFGEVTKDFRELKQSILDFTDKTSKIVGADKYIEHGNLADEVTDLIKSNLCYPI